MPRREKILIVDDEAALRLAFRQWLEIAGYAVAECADGEEALAYCEANTPALIMLDVDMPRRDGWSTLKELRRRGHAQPVLMLTQLADVKSIVRGLESGADDYLGKPCDLGELLARVMALLRRAGGAAEKAGLVLRHGEVEIDLEQHTATAGGEALKLTRTEYQLLALLSESPGKPVKREAILECIWNGRKGSSEALDTLLWRLRRKLGDTGDEPAWIQNLSGFGYVIPKAIVVTT